MQVRTIITSWFLLIAGAYATLTGLRRSAAEEFLGEAPRQVGPSSDTSHADEAHRDMAGSRFSERICSQVGTQIGTNVACSCTRSMRSLTYSCTAQKRKFNPTWTGKIDYTSIPIQGTNILKIPSATLYAQNLNYTYTLPEFDFNATFERTRGTSATTKLDKCTASYTNGTTTQSCTCQPCDSGTKITIDCTMIDLIPLKIRDQVKANCVTYTPVWHLRSANGNFVPSWYGWTYAGGN